MTLSTLVNRALMGVASAPGTGAITLGAAVTGFQTFAAAGLVTGNLASYTIEDGANWEVGQGTFTSPTTLARTTILASSSSGAAITATANALVGATALASDLTAWIQSPNDNRILNGNFALNQRVAVSGAALAAAAYGHDRWKAGASGCTYTFTATLPDTTITITAGTLTQVIEAGVIEGGLYTLSWTGTAQARVYQGTPTGAYGPSPIATTALTAGTNTIVEFNTGTVGKVKFESGAIATPFNRTSLARSQADCQRYYTTGAVGIVVSNAATGNAVGSTASFPVRMRAAPTMVLGALTVSINITSPANSDNVTADGFRYYFTATAAGFAQALCPYTAAAEL